MRNRYNTLVEGIGMDRVVAFFALGVDANGHHGRGKICKEVIDDVVKVSDKEAVDMAHSSGRKACASVLARQ